MKLRWVPMSGVLVGAVYAAWIYWPTEPDKRTVTAPSSSSKIAHSSSPPEQPLPPASVQSPNAAPSTAEQDAGAATLAQRLESNRLLKEAREAEGIKQLELYEDALKANPSNVDALMELGELRLHDEDYADAEALAKRCLKLDKDRVRCQETLERRYTRTGDFESAAKLYEGCLEETFVKVGCLAFNIGAALRADDVQRAKELHVRLAALSPQSIDTIVTEAAIATAEGDDDAARAAYARGCELGNEFACTWLSKQPRE